MTHYIAVVHKESDTDFGVSFPDFPGCVTAGKTIDEARELAQEALEFHVQGVLEDGEPLPVPSRLEDIMADPDLADAFAYIVVAVWEKRPRTVRVNITLPETTLRQIDAAARKRGMSRSSFLVHAAQSAMHSQASQ